LLSRRPEIVSEYRKLVKNGIEAIASTDAVEKAREATRQLLVDGQIVLPPSANRMQVTNGEMRLLEFGEHVLTLAGMPRLLKGTI
jgi:hypothetical protein